MALVSAGDSSPMPLTRRLREEDFTSNLCWLFVCSRTSFPEPVTRTRLAVPLWVFCFGMSSSCSSLSVPVVSRKLATDPGRLGGAVLRRGRSGAGRLLLGRLLLGPPAALVLRLGALVGGDHHDHVAAVLLRVGLDDAQLLDVGGQPLQQAVAHLGSRLLATPEHPGDLDLVEIGRAH